MFGSFSTTINLLDGGSLNSKQQIALRTYLAFAMADRTHLTLEAGDEYYNDNEANLKQIVLQQGLSLYFNRNNEQRFNVLNGLKQTELGGSPTSLNPSSASFNPATLATKPRCQIVKTPELSKLRNNSLNYHYASMEPLYTARVYPVKTTSDEHKPRSFAMPWLNGKDGVDYIAQRRRRFEKVPFDEATFEIAISALTHLKAIHKKMLIHRDIKPENIMVMPVYDPYQRRYRHMSYLLDFGLATDSENPDVYHPGTPGYAAPEAYYEDHHAAATQDVYSMGITLAEFFGVTKPTKICTPNDFLKKIAQFVCQLTIKIELNTNTISGLYLLLAGMIREPSTRRSSVDEALATLIRLYEQEYQRRYVPMPHLSADDSKLKRLLHYCQFVTTPAFAPENIDRYLANIDVFRYKLARATPDKLFAELADGNVKEQKIELLQRLQQIADNGLNRIDLPFLKKMIEGKAEYQDEYHQLIAQFTALLCDMADVLYCLQLPTERFEHRLRNLELRTEVMQAILCEQPTPGFKR
ncbi:MAG: hypothetical protein CMF50_08900 [Legionellales bacterium]|nr:hypothetical protein [Legionellales bacterium]|tara:strand:- start:15619 stop:17193 length:1575 start_codon:yes stop_codon:yes gene_type:complete